VIFIAMIAASGGLLFGFDNGITGGVIAQKPFQALFFPHMLNEDNTSSDPFCKYDDHLLQLFTSCLFLAGAVAAIIGSWTCKRFGRKATMMAGAYYCTVPHRTRKPCTGDARILQRSLPNITTATPLQRASHTNC